jgi:pyridoxamine 5'-phosphate oxidase
MLRLLPLAFATALSPRLTAFHRAAVTTSRRLPMAPSTTTTAQAPPAADVADLRVNYAKPGLSDVDAAAAASPTALFCAWLDEAVAADEPEPNAMCLSTVSIDGRPAARYVLLKGVDERGFVWYTNYNSRKAGELTENPAAALTFWWAGSERSVRVEGDVARVSAAESDAYFASRPAKSRLGAWASEQSAEVDGREVLEERWAALMEEYMPGGDGSEPVKEIVRPPHWGGFRLVPRRIEFWKGRASRLHDRVVFEREGEGARWTQKRLQP